MLRVHAERFVIIGEKFRYFIGINQSLFDDGILPSEDRADFIRFLGTLADTTEAFTLQVTARLVANVSRDTQSRDQQPLPLNAYWVQMKAGELSRAFVAELESRTYCFIPPDRQEYFIDPDNIGDFPFGEGVLDAFGSAAFDIISASECLSRESDTAAVLHLMRVLEIGLNSLANHFSVRFDRNWEPIIKDIENRIKEFSVGPLASRPPDWKDQEKLFADVAKEFRYLKNAWRNHAMHVRDKYGFNEAKTIFNHVRELMGALSRAGLRDIGEA